MIHARGSSSRIWHLGAKLPHGSVLATGLLLACASCSGESRAQTVPGNESTIVGPSVADQELLGREVRATIADVGERVMNGEPCIVEALDLIHLSLLGLAGSSPRAVGEGELELPLLLGPGFLECVARQVPVEAPDRSVIELRLSGPGLFGDLDPRLGSLPEQQVHLMLNFDEEGELMWCTCLFKADLHPDRDTQIALLDQGPVQIGAALKWSADEGLSWRRYVLEVSRGPANRSLIGRRFEEPKPLPSNGGVAAHYDPIRSILLEYQGDGLFLTLSKQ